MTSGNSKDKCFARKYSGDSGINQKTARSTTGIDAPRVVCQKPCKYVRLMAMYAECEIFKSPKHEPEIAENSPQPAIALLVHSARGASRPRRKQQLSHQQKWSYAALVPKAQSTSVARLTHAASYLALNACNLLRASFVSARSSSPKTSRNEDRNLR